MNDLEPSNADKTRSKGIAVGVWGAIGLIAAGITLAAVIDRRTPRIEEQVVTRQQNVFQTKSVLKDVTTEDGKRIKAYVDDSSVETVEVHDRVQVTREPTPEQRLRLNVLAGVCILLGALFLVLILAFFIYLYRGKKPPKMVEDWLKHFVSSLLGVVIGFLGAPTGESQVKSKPVHSLPAAPKST